MMLCCLLSSSEYEEGENPQYREDAHEQMRQGGEYVVVVFRLGEAWTVHVNSACKPPLIHVPSRRCGRP